MKLHDEYMRDCLKYENFSTKKMYSWPLACAETISVDTITTTGKRFLNIYFRSERTNYFYKSKIELYSEYDGAFYMYRDIGTCSRKHHKPSTSDLWCFSYLPSGDDYGCRQVHFTKENVAATLNRYTSDQGRQHFIALINDAGIDKYYSTKDNDVQLQSKIHF